MLLTAHGTACEVCAVCFTASFFKIYNSKEYTVYIHFAILYSCYFLYSAQSWYPTFLLFKFKISSPSPVIFFVYQIFPQNCELSYNEFYLNHLETTYILSQVLVPSSPGLLLLYTNSSLFCHCSFVKWRQRQGKSD